MSIVRCWIIRRIEWMIIIINHTQWLAFTRSSTKKESHCAADDICLGVSVLFQNEFCCGKHTSSIRPRMQWRSVCDNCWLFREQEFAPSKTVFKSLSNVLSACGNYNGKIIRLFAYKLPKIVPFAGRVFSGRLPGGVSLHGQKFRPLDTGNS